MDYNLLEEKLQKTLTDLGRREKELGVAEQEVTTTRCHYLCSCIICTLCPRDSVSVCASQTQRLQRELKAKYDLAHRELKAERDLGQRELQESSRRMQQECDHRVALQKDKIRLMEEERARLLRQVEKTEREKEREIWCFCVPVGHNVTPVPVDQITDGEARYKQLEKEFQAYREQQSIRPEVRLQSEINLLTLQKVKKS